MKNLDIAAKFGSWEKLQLVWSAAHFRELFQLERKLCELYINLPVRKTDSFPSIKKLAGLHKYNIVSAAFLWLPSIAFFFPIVRMWKLFFGVFFEFPSLLIFVIRDIYSNDLIVNEDMVLLLSIVSDSLNLLQARIDLFINYNSRTYDYYLSYIFLK